MAPSILFPPFFAASMGSEAASSSVPDFAAMLTALQKQNSDLQENLTKTINNSVENIKTEFNNKIDDLQKLNEKQLKEAIDPVNQTLEAMKAELARLKLHQQETDEKVTAMQADAAKPSSDNEDPDAAMVGGEFEGDSQTTQGKRKVFKSAFGPSYARAAAASSSASGGQSGGPAGHYIGTPRGATPGPAAPGPAQSKSSGGQAPASGQYHPEQIWVKGFVRRIGPTQQRDIWAKLFAAKLPANLKHAATVPDQAIGHQFRVLFGTSAQATEAVAILRPLCDAKAIVHWDNHLKQDIPLRVAADRTVRGRVAGRVINSLWKSLDAWLKEQGKPQEWTIKQDWKKSLYVEVGEDIFVVFDLRVSQEGEIQKLSIVEDGCKFLGLAESSAQDMIDVAAQMAAQPQ